MSEARGGFDQSAAGRRKRDGIARALQTTRLSETALAGEYGVTTCEVRYVRRCLKAQGRLPAWRERLHTQAETRPAPRRLPPELRARVLELMIAGRGNAEIARELGQPTNRIAKLRAKVRANSETRALVPTSDGRVGDDEDEAPQGDHAGFLADLAREFPAGPPPDVCPPAPSRYTPPMAFPVGGIGSTSAMCAALGV